MTLSEVCESAKITPPVFKKYQMLLNLGKGTFVGKCKRYSRQQVTVVEWIASARRFGISYAVIRQMLTPYTSHRLTEEQISYLKRRWDCLRRDWNILSSHGGRRK